MSFFKISEQYFQLMCFCENFFSFSFSCVFLSFTFNFIVSLIPYMSVQIEYHDPLIPFKNV